MNKMLAFILRDIRILLSYRLKFFLRFLSVFIPVIFIFFIGKTFEGAFSRQLARYNSDYFAFAILGMALSTFISTGLYSLSRQIRNAQVEGTLEALLMTPSSIYVILIGNSLWAFLLSYCESFFYIAVSIVVLQLSFTLQQLLMVFIVLLLTFGAFLSIGLLSASFTLVFKQGNPINMLFGASSYIIGGILFPVEVLPMWIRWFSGILPITQSGKLIRELLLVESGKREILIPFIYLIGFTLIVFPLGLLIFGIALKRARRDGSLIQY